MSKREFKSKASNIKHFDEACCFSVFSKNRSLDLQAPSKAVGDGWVAALKLILLFHNLTDLETVGARNRLREFMPAKVDTTAPKAALKDRIASFLDGGRTSGRLSGRNSFSSTPAASTAASTPASTPRKQESNLMDRLGGLFGGRKASVATPRGETIAAAPMTRPGRTPSYFDELTAKGVPVD